MIIYTLISTTINMHLSLYEKQMKEEIIFYCSCYCLKRKKKEINVQSINIYNESKKNVQCTVRIMILHNFFKRNEIVLMFLYICLFMLKVFMLKVMILLYMHFLNDS